MPAQTTARVRSSVPGVLLVDVRLATETVEVVPDPKNVTLGDLGHAVVVGGQGGPKPGVAGSPAPVS